MSPSAMKSRRHNVSEDPQTITRHSSRLDADEFSSVIPIELTIEIFSRLTLESIARCRCVSKQWASILRHHDFTDLFFTKSLARPKLLFALRKESEFLVFSTPQPRENASLITADHHVSFPVQYVDNISSPLNGIFCISHDPIFKKGRGTITREHVIEICNPSTRQSLTLPKIKKRVGADLRSFLGYDPIEKQHKVLAMTRQDDEHQVLTLGGAAGSLTWRMAECGIPHSFPGRECVCINGLLYYHARASDGDYMIVCFDVRSEKYSFVKAVGRGLLCEKLVNFQGKLASVRYQGSPFRSNTSKSLEMRILEDPEKHEWSMHSFNVPPMC